MAAAAAASSFVLLGLRDVAVPPGSSSSQDGPAANRLGGVANCIPSVTLVHPTCGLCRTALAHVLQIYCPLEGSPFHRIINVFACVTKSCWGNSDSWKVLRSQYLQEQGKRTQGCILKQDEQRPLAAKDWCEDADDWDDEVETECFESIVGKSLGSHSASPSLTGEMDCADQIQRLALSEAPNRSHPSHSRSSSGEEQRVPTCVPIFKPYYICVVEEEDCCAFGDMEHVEKLLQEYQRKEGVDFEQLMSESIAPDGCAEKYEKYGAGRRDRVFHKFMKRISVCREQILRYSWGGQPLFITCPSTDITAAIPPCNNCGSQRTFEFQLMPALVSELKSKEKDVSVEFGTALIYTCEKSCWPRDQPTPLEEFIFVQEDPDQQLFK